MADTKIILVKNGQVSAIVFPGERIDNTYGTVVAEVDMSVEIGVGDVYPAADAAPAKKTSKKAAADPAPAADVTETPAA
ncbi:hypothetical protein QCE62_00280 [Caballeronia sp. LZ033]|uniref:hypothetical protein n=1 Tax=Caballeronia sp. LZ033 TaxID=3038566 RepID=UPI00285ADB17|nr:hypothetical protein [Caballeronia sp. LZ033]MDR5812024.1 hypothetical protein [Caballeronia sp. LZ033]